MDPIVESVIDKLRSRSLKGVAKYGTTLAGNNGELLYWLNHLQEELMDGANYVERLMAALEENATDDGLDALVYCDDHNAYWVRRDLAAAREREELSRGLAQLALEVSSKGSPRVNWEDWQRRFDALVPEGTDVTYYFDGANGRSVDGNPKAGGATQPGPGDVSQGEHLREEGEG